MSDMVEIESWRLDSLNAAVRDLEYIKAGLRPLCPCVHGNPSDYEGPLQGCPIHGDGDTFVAEVRRLEDVEDSARSLRHYVGTIANRVGHPTTDPLVDAAQVELIGEQVLSAIERLQRDLSSCTEAWDAAQGGVW